MAKIIPITDLKKTSDVSSICHETEGPVFVSKNGYDDMVIMSTEEYDKINARLKLYSELFLSQQDIKDGNTKEAIGALNDLREKYDL